MENQPPLPSLAPPHNKFHSEVLKQFWEDKKVEIEETNDFVAQLPISRIKRIMKEDDGVVRVAKDATNLLAKASELFIQELTLRSWQYTIDHNRRTLQRADISRAVAGHGSYDFLDDTVPRVSRDPAVQNDVSFLAYRDDSKNCRMV